MNARPEDNFLLIDSSLEFCCKGRERYELGTMAKEQRGCGNERARPKFATFLCVTSLEIERRISGNPIFCRSAIINSALLGLVHELSLFG